MKGLQSWTIYLAFSRRDMYVHIHSKLTPVWTLNSLILFLGSAKHFFKQDIIVQVCTLKLKKKSATLLDGIKNIIQQNVKIYHYDTLNSSGRCSLDGRISETERRVIVNCELTDPLGVGSLL